MLLFFFTSGLAWFDLARHSTWAQRGVVNADIGSSNGRWYGEYICVKSLTSRFSWLVDQEQKSIECSCTMKGGEIDPILQSCVTVKTSHFLWKASCLVDTAPQMFRTVSWRQKQMSRNYETPAIAPRVNKTKRMWTAPWSRWTARPNPYFLYVLNTFRSTEWVIQHWEDDGVPRYHGLYRKPPERSALLSLALALQSLRLPRISCNTKLWTFWNCLITHLWKIPFAW